MAEHIGKSRASTRDFLRDDNRVTPDFTRQASSGLGSTRKQVKQAFTQLVAHSTCTWVDMNLTSQTPLGQGEANL